MLAPPKRGAVLFGLGTPGFDWAEGGDFFAFGLLAFARGWLGGGDVKVMTDCACWAALGTLAALIAIAGGVLALVLMLMLLRCGLALAGVTGDDAPSLVRAGADLPYAVGIAGGMAVWAWRFLPLP
jgi:prepilin peptidase CpaA